MGVYIPNMEKPQNCAECPFSAFDSNTELFCMIGMRENNCPLIEIDDELFKEAESAYVLQQIRRR